MYSNQCFWQVFHTIPFLNLTYASTLFTNNEITGLSWKSCTHFFKICPIVNYPVDKIIRPLNNWGQVCKHLLTPWVFVFTPPHSFLPNSCSLCWKGGKNETWNGYNLEVSVSVLISEANLTCAHVTTQKSEPVYNNHKRISQELSTHRSVFQCLCVCV